MFLGLHGFQTAVDQLIPALVPIFRGVVRCSWSLPQSQRWTCLVHLRVLLGVEIYPNLTNQFTPPFEPTAETPVEPALIHVLTELLRQQPGSAIYRGLDEREVVNMQEFITLEEYEINKLS